MYYSNNIEIFKQHTIVIVNYTRDTYVLKINKKYKVLKFNLGKNKIVFVLSYIIIITVVLTLLVKNE